MKRLMILAVACLTALAASAAEKMLLDSVRTSASYGPQDLEVYTYNEQGIAATYCVYRWQSGEWVLGKEYDLEPVYSADGRLFRMNQYLHTGGDRVLMSRVEYAYDADGRIISETSHSHSAAGTPWNNMARDLYVYDADGQVDTIYHEIADGSGWMPYMTLITVRDASTETTRVMDRFWTGYESEGADGQSVYSFSIHEVTALRDATLAPASRKILRDGQVLLMRDGECYDVLGTRR